MQTINFDYPFFGKIGEFSSQSMEESIERISKTALPIYKEYIPAIDNNPGGIFGNLHNCLDAAITFTSQILVLLDKEFELLFFPYKIVEQKSLNKPIYRVRNLADIGNRELFQEYSYAPVKKTEEMGRCSLPFFPMFYGSTNPSVALFEVLKSREHSSGKYCVSVWDIKLRDSLCVIQSFLEHPLPLDNPFSITKEEIIPDLNRRIFNNGLNPDQIKAINLYMSFLSSQFIVDDYTISSAIAHRNMHSRFEECTDILLFPSKHKEAKGVNLAIAPNFVENQMKMNRLYIIEVKYVNLRKNQLSFDVHEFGRINKNMIIWDSYDRKKPMHQKLFFRDFINFS